FDDPQTVRLAFGLPLRVTRAYQYVSVWQINDLGSHSNEVGAGSLSPRPGVRVVVFSHRCFGLISPTHSDGKSASVCQYEQRVIAVIRVTPQGKVELTCGAPLPARDVVELRLSSPRL